VSDLVSSDGTPAAGRIIWLASYPKSGNTWFRVFLTTLRGNPDAAVNINDLDSTPIASSRGIFDELTGIESSDLTPDEIDQLRPELYRQIAAEVEETQFMKVHDAFTEVAPGLPLFPASATRRALYFIRNPLDVAVSFAYHSGHGFDKMIARMANHKNAFGTKPRQLHCQLRQKLLSWSEHVLSWVEGTGFDVRVVRFEDMKRKPLETFEDAVRFCELPHSRTQVERAIEFTAFDKLRKQEEKDGFSERSPEAEFFFRKGEIGSWRQELNREQVARIIHDHGPVMRRFGYLDENGDVLT